MWRKNSGARRLWGSRRDAKQPTWTTPEPGMQTGIIDGEVVGHVVVAPGGYIAFGADTSPLGRFDTLPAARQAAVDAT
jgi:hypothetical protein